MQRTWFQQFAVLVAMGAIASSTLGIIAPAQANFDTSLIAQDATTSSLVGQCRAVNRSTPIFREASTSSEALRLLNPNQQVTLAGAGNNGLIRISAPINGFVQTVALKTCSNAGNPTGNTCRLVARPPEGLVIRREASATSTQVGGVAANARVALTTDPPTSRVDSAGRTWVQISRQAEGFISNGFANQTNLVFCPR